MPLAAWGPLLGEGALHAFARLERAEENALLRSASCEDVRAHDGVHLDAIDVERAGARVAAPRRAHGRARPRCGPRAAHARCRGCSSDERCVRLGDPLPALTAIPGNARHPAARPAGALRWVYGGRVVGTVARPGRSGRLEGEQNAC